MSYPVRRAMSVMAILAAVVGVLIFRAQGSPGVEVFRTAMAPAPDGGLYAALAGRRFVQVGPDGRIRAEWLAPAPPPLSLAASGDNVLLGTAAGLFLSVNRGRTWSYSLAPGRFLTVAIRGQEALAGAWAEALWSSHDGGTIWSRAPTPAGDTEFESVAIGQSCSVVVTLLGALASCHGSWDTGGAPGRMTAVDALDGTFLAGDWRGHVLSSAGGGAFEMVGSVPAGIWAVAGPAALLATTRGIYSTAGRLVAFGDREVTALSLSGEAVYAAVAGGPIYVSTDRGQSWRLALQR